MQESTEFAPSPEGREGPRDILGVLAWVGRDPGLTPSNKAVLLAVVAHADEQGICSATDKTLARASRTSIPTVQKTLKLFEDERVIRRSYRPHDAREIRLITGEQSLVVVDVLEDLEKQQQQQDGPRDCSPVSSPVEPERPDAINQADEETERLVAMLIDRNVAEKVARKLVRMYPDRIIPQVEAHRHRRARNAAGLLVVAIEENYPIVLSQTPPSPQEQQKEARKKREGERQAALDAQAVENARKRVEEKRVLAFWDGLSREEKDALDEEAIEASPHRDEIRRLSPGSPMFRGQKAAARWAQVRRKLGLGVEG